MECTLEMLLFKKSEHQSDVALKVSVRKLLNTMNIFRLYMLLKSKKKNFFFKENNALEETENKHAMRGII